MRHSAGMKHTMILCWLLGLMNVSAFELPEKSTQCVVGISEGWDSSHVTLTYHEKKDGKWQQVGRHGKAVWEQKVWCGGAVCIRIRPERI